MKTTGHSNTPAVRLKEKLSPKNRRLTGLTPSVFSSEKIFVPITSAISALVIKKPPRIINKRVALLLMILLSIEMKDVKDLKQ